MATPACHEAQSKELKAERHHRLKIIPISGSERGVSTDGHRRIATVGIAFGTASGFVKKHLSEFGILSGEVFHKGKDQP